MKRVLSVLLVMGILFSFGVRGSGDEEDPYPEYEALFTHGNLHEVEIVITQEEWDGLIQDMKDYAEDDFLGLGRTGNYRKVTFIYKGPAGDTTIEEVGFRTKGNASRTIPQDDNGNFHRAHFKVRLPLPCPRGTPWPWIEYPQRGGACSWALWRPCRQPGWPSVLSWAELYGNICFPTRRSCPEPSSC